MPRLRSYQPDDYPHFLALDVETAQDALGDATDDERTKLRERLGNLRQHRPQLLHHRGKAIHDTLHCGGQSLLGSGMMPALFIAGGLATFQLHFDCHQLPKRSRSQLQWLGGVGGRLGAMVVRHGTP